MAANHIKLIENCFSKLCELITAIKNGEDGAKLQKICNEISLRETEADFCLQSVTAYAEPSYADDKISEFSHACDSIANRCEDFANGIRRTNKDMVAMFSADILEMLQKISCLFELMQQMFAAKEVGVLTEKIDSAEEKYDLSDYGRENVDKCCLVFDWKSDTLPQLPLLHVLHALPLLSD